MTDKGELPKAEVLRSLVKGNVIENYTKDGYSEFDDSSPLFHILNQVDNQTYYSKYAKDNEATVIVLSPKNISGGTALQKDIANAKFAPNDVLVCFSVGIKDVDQHHRRGNMRGIMVLSLQDVNTLTNEMQKNPGFLFSLIRKLNEKPIVRKAEGLSLPEVTSKEIKFIPNDKYGGVLKQPVVIPIPASVNPTQILLR